MQSDLTSPPSRRCSVPQIEQQNISVIRDDRAEEALLTDLAGFPMCATVSMLPPSQNRPIGKTTLACVLR
jgi:hypothetical protein